MDTTDVKPCRRKIPVKSIEADLSGDKYFVSLIEEGMKTGNVSREEVLSVLRKK